jgi:hypothetical protein
MLCNQPPGQDIKNTTPSQNPNKPNKSTRDVTCLKTHKVMSAAVPFFTKEPLKTSRLLMEIAMCPECPAEILLWCAILTGMEKSAKIPRRFKNNARYIWRRLYRGIRRDAEQERLATNFKPRPRRHK